MMSHLIKSSVESEMVFEKIHLDDEHSAYPSIRRVIIHCYGGNAESCVAKARSDYALDVENWNLVSYEAGR